MQVHVEKKGIRALGIAESFRKEDAKSILAGVVMRSDLVIDGFVFGSATVGGDDATKNIITMYRSLNRTDINIIILSGAVISLYNIIDVDKVGTKTKIPVISVTYDDSEGLEPHIKRHFPRGWRKKIRSYRRLGEREEVTLKTGYKVFVRQYGLDMKRSKRVLDKFTLQGALPEPLKLARLLAKAMLDFEFEAQMLTRRFKT